MRAARGVARMVQRCMERLRDTVRIRNYRVCNVLATCKMPFGVKIEEMSKQYPQQSQYEPELSVGLVWRSQDPKATLRIHTTGSVTVTGATSEAAVMQAIEKIYPIIKKFHCPLRLRGTDKDKVDGSSDGGRGKRSRKRKATGGHGAGASGGKRGRGGARGRPGRDAEFTGAGGGSGMYGTKMYFSDEEEEEEDNEILDDDEDGFEEEMEGKLFEEVEEVEAAEEEESEDEFVGG